MFRILQNIGRTVKKTYFFPPEELPELLAGDKKPSVNIVKGLLAKVYSRRQNYRKKKDRKIPELTEKKREIFCINFFSIIRFFSIISFFYNSVGGYN